MTNPHPVRSLPVRLGLIALVALSSAAARAVEPLVQHDVVLLQPGTLIEQRVQGGADAMADYVKRLGAAATATMRVHTTQIPSAGFIVVAVRPGDRTHTWFDFKPALDDATTAALTRAVESTPTMPVKSGEIVFALRVSVWSDKPPKAYAPAPQEWKDAVKGLDRKPDVDALVDRVWPP
jgi:hypothetical protein